MGFPRARQPRSEKPDFRHRRGCCRESATKLIIPVLHSYIDFIRQNEIFMSCCLGIMLVIFNVGSCYKYVWSHMWHHFHNTETLQSTYKNGTINIVYNCPYLTWLKTVCSWPNYRHISFSKTGTFKTAFFFCPSESFLLIFYLMSSLTCPKDPVAWGFLIFEKLNC